MKEEFTNETLLARWLSGELTKEEQKQLENHADFKAWKQIAETAATFEPPPLDTTAAYKRLSLKLKEQEPKQAKVRTLGAGRRLFIYGAAASLLLLVGWFVFLRDDGVTTLTTNIGEQMAQTLPDGSNIQLNANSSIYYSQRSWTKNRTLKLDGEAFFKVKTGSTFTVNTALGQVEVVGTSFNIRSREEDFEVRCYTGKVTVKSAAKDTVFSLQEGEGIQISKDTVKSYVAAEDDLPNWIKGESHFNGVVLSKVIDELERQYDYEVMLKAVDKNRLFTGYFPHKDIDQTLKLICEPLGLTFKIEDKLITIN